MEKEKLCLRCMRKIGNNTVCPYCRDESSVSREADSLPLKTVVGERYLIGKAVSSNAEGITYNAFDMETKTPVTLRELFPEGMLARGEGNYCLVNVGKASEFIDAKEAFIKLWKALLSISGYTALPTVHQVFEDLGTVYSVTEFMGDGKTLRDFLLEKEQGCISWDEARVLLMPIVSAMGELHASGITHGGISPNTLVIDSKGKLKITGFSTEAVRVAKTNMEAELFEGYAAVEQYGMSAGLGAYTDIYAFAAVLYRTLIGSTPMNASSRLVNDKLMIPGKFAEQLPAYVINALVNALQIMPEDRTESVELLRNELSASPAAAGTAAEAFASLYEDEEDDASDVDEYVEEEAEEPGDEEIAPTRAPLKKSTIAAFAISAAICLAILIAVLVGVKLLSKDDGAKLPADESTTTAVAQSNGDNNSIKSIKLPDFKGKVYDDIKNDEKYKDVLIFKTEYIDSPAERGTVVSQNINAGTEVTSINPKTIVLQISNGLEVPDVIGYNLQEAIKTIKAEGFKNVKSESAQIAGSKAESNTVYRIAYEDTKTGDWAEIPSDKRLSSGDIIIIYYYGEYVETTEEITTQKVTVPVTDEETQPVSEQTQETVAE
ncbi:MAG: PASTA domain-containing protein [Clostridia bacterium]|nr:PASTA domain-containing protein [Clostridia bacterium]